MVVTHYETNVHVYNIKSRDESANKQKAKACTVEELIELFCCLRM